MSDPEIEELRDKVQLRRRARANAAALDARPEGEHQAQPQIPAWQGRDPDRQPRRQRLVGSDQRRQGRCVRSGPEAGAGGQLRPCPKAPARIRGPFAELSDRRKGRAPQSLGQTRRRTLGRSEGRVAGFADLALSRPEALPSIGDHRGGFRGRRPAGGPGRQRLVRSFQRRGFRRPRRHSRADLQRLAHRRRQVPLLFAPSLNPSRGSFSPRPRSTL